MIQISKEDKEKVLEAIYSGTIDNAIAILFYYKIKMKN